MSELAEQIMLETPNPMDLEPNELSILAEELKGLVAPIPVRVAYFDQHGAGVTFLQELAVWVPASYIGQKVCDTIIGYVSDWAKKRFARRPTREQHITVYDPDGKEIFSMLINSDGVKHEKTDRARPARRRPPVRPGGDS
jgi:hypothetical protein